jgi:hypothetical protein
MSDDDLDRARAFVAKATWTFAKTLAHIPHYYETRQRFGDDEEFTWFVTYVRERGYRGRFQGATYTYLEIGEWKYWSMWRAPEKTQVINRERLPAAEPLFPRQEGR